VPSGGAGGDGMPANTAGGGGGGGGFYGGGGGVAAPVFSGSGGGAGSSFGPAGASYTTSSGPASIAVSWTVAPPAVAPGPSSPGPGPTLPSSPPPAPAPPCTGFALIGAVADRSGGSITVTLRVGGRGALDLLGTEDVPRAWTARIRPGRDRFAYGRRGAARIRAGRVRLRLLPNAKGRLLLRRHRRRGWALHIRVWAIYTRADGRSCARVRKVRMLKVRVVKRRR
jgi:hypothetical protein